jgi:serine/threonine-protein kinase RsbW
MHDYGRENRDRVGSIDLCASELVRRVTLRSLADLRPLSEVVENWMRVLGYPRRDIFAVTLALNEATVNAFRHGNLGDPRKVVRIDYLVTNAEVVLEVEDEGPGFDPNQVADPLAPESIPRTSGRGLFLMRVYLSGVSFNRQGNRVTLYRRRSPA